MSVTAFLTETRRAISRRGAVCLCAIMLGIAGITWGSRGPAMGIGVLVAGLATGTAVLVIRARSEIHSDGGPPDAD